MHAGVWPGEYIANAVIVPMVYSWDFSILRQTACSRTATSILCGDAPSVVLRLLVEEPGNLRLHRHADG